MSYFVGFLIVLVMVMAFELTVIPSVIIAFLIGAMIHHVEDTVNKFGTDAPTQPAV